MEQTISADAATRLLEAYARKGWHVKGIYPSNPRIGSVYREVDEIQAIAIGWSSR